MERVGVEFVGNSAGAVGAAKATSQAIRGVRHEANTLSPSLHRAERDIGKVSRGAFAGSGVFRGLGRSVAYASGAFLGGYGLVYALESAVKATLDSATSTAHLDQAIRNAHASVRALTPILAKHADTSRRLGFADDETRKAEQELITAFGATKHALGELGVAQDLARTKNESLSTATYQLIQLQEGNTRVAKQFGVAIPDLSKKIWEQKAAQDHLTVSQEKGKVLYDELTQRVKGQAKAFAATPSGKIAEFHSEITKLEESIGTGLLPVVDKYLTRVDAWLADSGNQKRVTHDVEVVVHDLEGALRDAYGATKAVLAVVKPLVHVMGGWKGVLEGIVALKFAGAVAGWVGALSKFSGVLGGGAAGGVAGAGGALSRTGALLANMKNLARIGTLAIGVDLLFQSKGQGSKGLIGALLTGAAMGASFGPWGALIGGAAALTIDVILQKGPPAGGLETGVTDGNSHHHVLGNADSSGLSGGPGKGSSRPVDIFYDDRKKAFFVGFNDGHAEKISAGQAAHQLHISVADLYKAAGIAGRGKRNGGKGDGGRSSATSGAIVSAGKKLGGLGGGTYVLGGGHQSGEVKIGSVLDCSGFIYQSLLRAGVKGFSYGTAAAQFGALQAGAGGNWAATNVGVGGAKPGDLVYWNNLVHGEQQPGHAGIVVTGSGSNARVMAYENSHDGSGVQGIGIYPVRGVFRITIVKGRPGSPYGPALGNSGGSPSATSVAAVTGSNLIPIGLRGAIGHARDMATKAADARLAAKWLHIEIGELEQARAGLEAKLKSSSGKQKTAIQAEIQSIDHAIAATQKSFAGALAGWARTELAKLEKQADAKFRKQTASYIANVLGPQYFQGVDAQGNQRLTPAEKKLAAMQAQDQADQLQQALDQAKASGDPAQIAAAERAIEENDLATQATKERAQADADYAKAVKRYQKDRDKLEAKMNHGLSKFVDQVARGTAALSGLSKVLERYGVGGSHDGGGGGAGGGHRHKHHHHGHGLSGGMIPMAGRRTRGPTHVRARDLAAVAGDAGQQAGDISDAIEKAFVRVGIHLVAGDVYLDREKVGRTIARPVADAQRRQIAYTLQRG